MRMWILSHLVEPHQILILFLDGFGVTMLDGLISVKLVMSSGIQLILLFHDSLGMMELDGSILQEQLSEAQVPDSLEK